MFGIRKSKVLTEGAQAEGVVIDSQAPADTGEGGIGRTYRLTARVRFDDGTTTEVASGRLDRTKVGWNLEGDIVPVRYDPTDRSKIEIDVPALIAAREQGVAELRNSAIAGGEDDLARRADT
jgi:Protein of unknown function (DUF3592)